MEKMYYKTIKLNPAISTESLGDYIVEDYCNAALSEIFGDYMLIVFESGKREKYSSFLFGKGEL